MIPSSQARRPQTLTLTIRNPDPEVTVGSAVTLSDSDSLAAFQNLLSLSSGAQSRMPVTHRPGSPARRPSVAMPSRHFELRTLTGELDRETAHKIDDIQKLPAHRQGRALGDFAIETAGDWQVSIDGRCDAMFQVMHAASRLRSAELATGVPRLAFALAVLRRPGSFPAFFRMLAAGMDAARTKRQRDIAHACLAVATACCLPAPDQRSSPPWQAIGGVLFGERANACSLEAIPSAGIAYGACLPLLLHSPQLNGETVYKLALRFGVIPAPGTSTPAAPKMYDDERLWLSSFYGAKMFAAGLAYLDQMKPCRENNIYVDIKIKSVRDLFTTFLEQPSSGYVLAEPSCRLDLDLPNYALRCPTDRVSLDFSLSSNYRLALLDAGF